MKVRAPVKQIILFAGCLGYAAQASAQLLPAELVGTWNVEPSSVRVLGLPPACESIRIRYAADGEVEYASGELKYKAKATAKDDGKGLTVEEVPYENNGGRNCQGRSAEFFFSHYSSASYIEIRGTEMRVYLLGKEKPISLVYKRD